MSFCLVIVPVTLAKLRVATLYRYSVSPATSRSAGGHGHSTPIMSTAQAVSAAGATQMLKEAQALLSESRAILSELRKIASEFKTTSQSILKEMRAMSRDGPNAVRTLRPDRPVAVDLSLLDFDTEEQRTLAVHNACSGARNHPAVPNPVTELVNHSLIDFTDDSTCDHPSLVSRVPTVLQSISSTDDTTLTHALKVESGIRGARRYTIPELLSHRAYASSIDDIEGSMMLKEISNKTTISESVPKVIWTLRLPFATRTLKRGNSYMTSQLLEISVFERLVDGQWKIPRTLAICSTQRMADSVIEKMEKCLAEAASRHPEIDRGWGVAVAHDRTDIGQILQESSAFASNEKPLMVCSPKYAVDFLTAEIDQVYWLNVKTAGMEDLLKAFKHCNNIISKPP